MAFLLVLVVGCAGFASDASAQWVTVTVPADAEEGDSGTTDKTLTTTKVGGPAVLNLTWCFTGTATLGTDYTVHTAFNVSLAQTLADNGNCYTGNLGPANENLKLRIVGDTTVEEDETIIVTVTPRGSSAVTATYTIKTESDEAPPAVSFSSSTYATGEGQAARPVLVLSKALTADLAVSVVETAGTATSNGVDYTTGPYRVTIPAGQTQQAFDIPTVKDTRDDEGAETFTITVSSVGLPSGVIRGSPRTATVTIVDPTVVTLARASGNTGAIAEGGSAKAELTVTLGRKLVAGERIDVPVVFSGPGIAAADFTWAKKPGASLNTGVRLSGTGLTRTVTFEGAEAQTATLEIAARVDNTAEGGGNGYETLAVALGTNAQFEADTDTNVLGGAKRHGSTHGFSVRIDDASYVTVKFEAVDLVMTEGDASDTARVRIKLSRRLLAGETAKFSIDPDSLSSDVREAYDAIPDFTVAIAGTGVAVVGPNTSTPILTFTGHATDVVQEAVVTLTPVADRDDGNTDDGTVVVRFRSTFPQTSLSGDGLAAGSPSAQTITHADDDEEVEVKFEAVDLVMTEGDASDTARVRVKLSRRLGAGETAKFSIGIASASSDVRESYDATPDYAIAFAGTGLSVSGPNTATPVLTFTGHATNVVQEATVTLTPVASRDDGNTQDGTVTVRFVAVQSGTRLGGDILVEGTPYRQIVTHYDDDVTRVLVTVEAVDLVMTEGDASDTARVRVKLSRRLLAGETAKFSIAIDSLSDDVRESWRDTPDFTVAIAGTGVAVVGPNTSTPILTFTGHATNVVQEATVTLTPVAGRPDGNADDGTVGVYFNSGGVFPQTSLNGDVLSTGSPSFQTVTHSDVGVVAVNFEAVDLVMTEGDASDTARVRVKLSRRLGAGETAKFSLSVASPDSDVRESYDATPDYAIAFAGTGLSVSGPNTATPVLTFTGHATNVVQEATVTLTPVASRDDGNTQDGEVLLRFVAVQSGTRLGGDILVEGVGLQWVTHYDDDATRVVVTVEAVDLVMTEGDASDTARVRVKLSRRLLAGETAKFSLSIDSPSDDVRESHDTTPDYAIAFAGTGVAVAGPNTPTPVLTFTGHATNVVQEATVTLTPVAGRPDGNAADGTVGVYFHSTDVFPQTSLNGDILSAGSPSFQTITHSDVGVVAVNLEAVDLAMTEGDASDTARVRVKLSRRLGAGETAKFSLSVASPSSDVRESYDATPDYAIAFAGTGLSVSGPNSATPVLTFTGHATNVVQEAVVTLTPVASRDDGNLADGTVTVAFLAVQSGASLGGDILVEGSPYAQTITHTDDDEEVEVNLEAVDLVMTEGDASDTARVRVKLSRRLGAGETAKFSLSVASPDSDVRESYDATPDYAIAFAGTGLSVSGPNTATPVLTFTGHATNVVQEATVTLTPVASRDDGNTQDGEVLLRFVAVQSGTRLGGDILVEGVGLQWVTHYDDDATRVLVTVEAVDLVMTEGDASDTARVRVKLSRRLLAGETAKFSLSIDSPSDDVRESHDTTPDYAIAFAGTGVAVAGPNTPTPVLTFTGHATNVVQEATVTLTPVAGRPDGNAADGTVGVYFHSTDVFPQTSLNGDILSAGSPSFQTITHSDDDNPPLTVIGPSDTVHDDKSGEAYVGYSLSRGPSKGIPYDFSSPTDTGPSTTPGTIHVATTVTGGEWGAEKDYVMGWGGGGISSTRHQLVKNSESSATISGFVNEGSTAFQLHLAMNEYRSGPPLTLTVTTVVTDNDGGDSSGAVTQPADVTVMMDRAGAPARVGTPVVTIAPKAETALTEGGSAVFVVSAYPKPSSNLTVNLTVDDAPNADFIAAGDEGARTVTIAANTEAVEFTVATKDKYDRIDEPSQNIKVTVNAGTDYKVGAASSAERLIEDDNPTVIKVEVNNEKSIAEGETKTYTAKLETERRSPRKLYLGESIQIALNFSGSATKGTDYTLACQSPLPAGVTCDFTDFKNEATLATLQGKIVFTGSAEGSASKVKFILTTIADDVTESGGETVDLEIPLHPDVLFKTGIDTEISDGSPVESTFKILDPVGITVSFNAATYGVTEGSAAKPELVLSKARATATQVTVVSTDQTATGTNSVDYTPGPYTVTIPANETRQSFSIATTADSRDEQPEKFTLSINSGSLPSGVTLGAQSTATVTISDPTALPVVSIAGGSRVTEGTAAAFTVSAGNAAASDLTIKLNVAEKAGSDYVASGNEGDKTVTLTAGQTSVTYNVATTGDSTDAPNGGVTVTVGAGTGYTVAAAPANAATVAVDDDDATSVVLAGGAAALEEGASRAFTLTIGRALRAGETLTVPLVFTGTATKGTDYTLACASATGVACTFTAGSEKVVFTGSAEGSATSVTLTLSAATDSTAEAGGETVNVNPGTPTHSGLGGGAATPTDGFGEFRITDPPPVVSIAAGAGVTEGTAATFTVKASRAPAADLTVKLSVSEAAGSDFVASGDEGATEVTILASQTSASVSVATVDDADDEPNGSVTVTVGAGTGYEVAAAPANAATVAVADNDVSDAPTISVSDAQIKEVASAWQQMKFTLTLSEPVSAFVWVLFRTLSTGTGPGHAEGTPTQYHNNRYDYQSVFTGAGAIQPGQTTGHLIVTVYGDYVDEGDETFKVELRDPRADDRSEIAIGDGVAIGTIKNDGPLPAAWLARFGRTVAEATLDGISDRMAADRTPGVQGSLGGHAIAFDPQRPGHPSSEHDGTLARALGAAEDRLDAGEPETLTGRELLLGSRFTLTGEADASGGSVAFWGRASERRFDGAEGPLALDGEVTTGMLGADYARGDWLVGFALAQSEGQGGWRGSTAESAYSPEGTPLAGSLSGEVESSLTAALPYAALQASERLKLWGAAGFGAGEVTLTTGTGQVLRADTGWTMAAAGLRGDLLGAASDGPALALTSDALWARATSDRSADGMAASESDVTRLRLGLEGGWAMALEGGGSLTPKLEVGARHDGGDAETGFGVELGGGLAWSAPTLGLRLDVEGRTLLAHDDGDLEDRGLSAALGFDPAPDTERGLSLSLRQEMGGQAGGGIDALFADNPLSDRAGSDAASRWTAEAAYGFPAFAGRFTGSPHVGVGLATGARDYSLGWRWTPAANAPELSFGVKATRHESDTDAPEHTVGLEATARW